MGAGGEGDGASGRGRRGRQRSSRHQRHPTIAVGWSATATGEEAVRWSPSGTATVLHGLKGSTVSEAVAENNQGQSIGYSDTAKGDDAILWGPKGGIAAVLKDPGGQGVEFALAINDSGQSVGYADIAGGGTEAVLWQPSGKATNLGALLGSDWSNTEAVGINNLGDIVGYGHYNNGTVSGTYGFLLTPAAATAVSAIPAPPRPPPSFPHGRCWLSASLASALSDTAARERGKRGAKSWPKSIGPGQRSHRD